MPLNSQSIHKYLTPELLEQLAVPVSALLAFLWLFSRRRYNATPGGGVAAAPPVPLGAVNRDSGDVQELDECKDTESDDPDIYMQPAHMTPDSQANDQHERTHGEGVRRDGFAQFATPAGGGFNFPARVSPPFPLNPTPGAAAFSGHPAPVAKTCQGGHPPFPAGPATFPTGSGPFPAGRSPAAFAPAAFPGGHAAFPAVPPAFPGHAAAATVKGHGTRSKTPHEMSFRTKWKKYRAGDHSDDSDAGQAPPPPAFSSPNVPAESVSGAMQTKRSNFNRKEAKQKQRVKVEHSDSELSELTELSELSDAESLPLKASSRAQTPSTVRFSTPRRVAGTSSTAAPSSGQHLATPVKSRGGSVASNASTTSRYVSPPDLSRLSPSQVKARFPRVTRDRPSTKLVQGPRISFAFFEWPSERLLSNPPDLRAHPEIQVEDVFYNRCALVQKYRIWVWTEREEWLRVNRGYRRSDGLYLSLTESGLNPTWLPEKSYRQRERQIQALGSASPIREESDVDSDEF
ncbi:hypothetical protein L226DRAFT_571711 [Lentinus tigrinus ALCF2SS1-7]|uniref:uncharacterized protein n=1 Tax=Lentinus tigrinus ALCF2SS1-7 TaxID=1328758 RepID=UPI0011663CFA|nr:hypothetical protein L226DRAFT_571711 [Lentinus tigrinus ALCF2SS1-7]